jgi:hypothetical protein
VNANDAPAIEGSVESGVDPVNEYVRRSEFLNRE